MMIDYVPFRMFLEVILDNFFNWNFLFSVPHSNWKNYFSLQNYRKRKHQNLLSIVQNYQHSIDFNSYTLYAEQRELVWVLFEKNEGEGMTEVNMFQGKKLVY